MGLSKLIFILAIALAGWFFYRKFVAEAQKLARVHETRRKTATNRTKGTLVLDPKTGEYRLKREEE